MRRRLALAHFVVGLSLALGGCGGGGGGSASSNTATLVTFRGGAPTSADWVAFQDGTGAWRRLAASGSGVYAAAVTDAQGRYAFACVVGAPETRVFVYEATLAEAARLGVDLGEPAAGYAVQGAITGAPAPMLAVVGVGRSETVGAGGAYRVDGVPQGSWDVAAFRSDFTTGSMASDRGYLLRSLAISADTLLPIDFAGARSFVPETYAVGLSGLSGAGDVVGLVTEAFLHTSGGTRCRIGMGGSNGTYAALPVGLQAAADAYVATGYEERGATTLFRRSRTVTFVAPDAVDLALGAQLTGVAIAEGPAGTYRRVAAHWNPLAGADAYDILLGQFGAADLIWEVVVTSARLAGVGSYTSPDLAGTPGWTDAWGLRAGTLDWSVEAFDLTGSVTDLTVGSAGGAMSGGLSVTASSVSGVEGRAERKQTPRLVRRFLKGL